MNGDNSSLQIHELICIIYLIILSFIFGMSPFSYIINIEYIKNMYNKLNKRKALIVIIVLNILIVLYIILCIIIYPNFVYLKIFNDDYNTYTKYLILISIVTSNTIITYMLYNYIHEKNNLILDIINDVNEFNNKVIDKYIYKRKNNISSIIQTYINNNTLTDYKDFINYNNNNKDKIDILNSSIIVERIFAITKPTDLYYVLKQVNSNTYAKLPNRFIIKIIKNSIIKNAYMTPYPNYTIIEYNNKEKILAETFPQNLNPNLPPTENSEYRGYIYKDNEYIESRISAIEEIITIPADNITLTKYKIELYKNNKIMYLWAIVYMIYKIINDSYSNELIEVYIVGSFADIYNTYHDNIINNKSRKIHETNYNDIDIIINVNRNKSEIEKDLMKKINYIIEDVINIYKINDNKYKRLNISVFKEHTPIIKDESYLNTSNVKDNIIFHTMITTPDVYNDVSKLVRYHRSKHIYSFNENNQLAIVNEYTLNDVLNEPLGIKDMLSMLKNKSVRKALWNLEGKKYVYHSLTTKSKISEKKENLYISITTNRELCRLYKYIIKWSTINIAYASDISSKGIVIEEKYKTKYVNDKEKLINIIHIINNNASNKLTDEDVNKLIQTYNTNCNNITKNIEEYAKVIIEQYLENIKEIIIK